MTIISTFLIWKSSTTGIPSEDGNRTKFTKLSLIAVSKKDLLKGGKPKVVGPRNWCLDPEFDACIEKWGTFEEDYENDYLEKTWEENYEEDPESYPTFREHFEEISSFIKSLPKPVCLVAHYGDNFDFPILMAECKEAKRILPKDLLCVDSLTACRHIVPSEKRHSLLKMYSILCNKDVGLVFDEQIGAMVLLECLVAIKDKFVPWATKNCKLFKSIKPLSRPGPW